jgi:murein DD-endopeptidase MepM/ murein hydrolase activator NlpD
MPGSRPAARPRSRSAVALAVLGAALAAALCFGGPAPAADLQSEVDAKRAQLSQVRERQGVLTTTISRYGDRIARLEAEVASVRTAEAAAEARLAAKQAQLERAETQLHAARVRLRALREQLRRALVVLRERLVAIYRAGTTDELGLILSAEGYDELISRSEYLEQIQDHDDAVVGRVRDLRDEAKRTVRRLRDARRRIEAARDAIATEERRLAAARAAVESRQADLVAVRGARASALAGLESREEELHGDLSALQARIEAQLQAAESTAPLPAGPVRQSSSGLIWPVDGPVVSGFGWRWGRMHEGIDIAVPAGTPIRAAAAGTVVLLQSEAESGGYGNYTCLDHGGGLASCYAHQSSFAVTSGAVGQGDVIGYVGCTGHCFGDHLHFEVRVNGVAQDPMGYL